MNHFFRTSFSLGIAVFFSQVSLAAPPTGGDDEETATDTSERILLTDVATPQAPRVIESVQVVISELRAGLQAGPNRPNQLSRGRGQNFRLPGDVVMLDQFRPELGTEKEMELRRVLGNVGYHRIYKLTDAVVAAAQKADPWAEIRRAFESFPDEDDMEIIHAKALYLAWLREEERLHPSSGLQSALAFLTIAPVVSNADLEQVLSRIEEAATQAKVTDPKQVLAPTAQLVMLAPYLPALSHEQIQRLLDSAFTLAANNTDLSVHELVELFVNEVVPALHKSKRLNTTLGAHTAVREALTFWRRFMDSPQCTQSEAGTILTAAERISINFDQRTQLEEEKVRERDLALRSRTSLRAFLTQLLADKPEFVTRLGEFPSIRVSATRAQVARLCAEAVANPLSTIVETEL